MSGWELIPPALIFYNMTLNALSSAIINDLFSGNFIQENDRSLISVEQIEDECIEARSSVILDR